MRSAAIVLACATVACSRATPVGQGGGAALMRNLLRAREIEIVAAEGPLAEASRRAATLLARERNVVGTVRGPAVSGNPRSPRIVVTAASKDVDPFALELLARIGITVGSDAAHPSFTFLKTVFDGPFDALVAVLEDPGRPGLPVTLLYGNDAAALARHASGIDAGWNPWLRIYRADALSLEGPLSTDGRPREAALVDREPQRVRTFSNYHTHGSADAAIRIKAASGANVARIRAYLASVDRAKQETLRWCGAGGVEIGAGAGEIDLVLHAHPEKLFEFASSPELSSCIPAQKSVHALLAEGVPDDARGARRRDSLRSSCSGPRPKRGSPTVPPCTPPGGGGVGISRNGSDGSGSAGSSRASTRSSIPTRRGQTRDTSCSRCAPRCSGSSSRAEGRPSCDPCGREPRTCNRRRRPRGPSSNGWTTSPRGTGSRATSPAGDGRRTALVRSFLAAVGIEESGAGPDRGFGSEVFERSLGEAWTSGARAVVLTCYLAAEPDPLPIADLEARIRDFEPLESDVRVFCGLVKARARGMRAYLQPRLLNGPGGTLAGTDPQGKERDWQKFFDAYSRFAIHVGLLAELAGAEGLVLGGGMTASTNGVVGEQAGTPEQARWRSEGWEKVLRTARGAFAGCLTWAADSPSDAQVLSFWSDLDAIGCDLEPGLDRGLASFHPKPGVLIERRIQAEISAFEDLARTRGQPLILTRAGFRTGAPRPGRPALARPGADPGLATLELEVLGRELRKAQDRGVLRGVVLWRWSSDPDDDGATEKDAILRRGPVREAAARALSGL